jgi:hypothetical protein
MINFDCSRLLVGCRSKTHCEQYQCRQWQSSVDARSTSALRTASALHVASVIGGGDVSQPHLPFIRRRTKMQRDARDPFDETPATLAHHCPRTLLNHGAAS